MLTLTVTDVAKGLGECIAKAKGPTIAFTTIIELHDMVFELKKDPFDETHKLQSFTIDHRTMTLCDQFIHENRNLFAGLMIAMNEPVMKMGNVTVLLKASTPTEESVRPQHRSRVNIGVGAVISKNTPWGQMKSRVQW
jgi:hypothetical protein